MSISGLFDAHSSMSSFSGQNWRSATSLLVECSAAQTNGSDKAVNLWPASQIDELIFMERQSDLSVLWFVRRAFATTVQ